MLANYLFIPTETLIMEVVARVEKSGLNFEDLLALDKDFDAILDLIPDTNNQISMALHAWQIAPNQITKSRLKRWIALQKRFMDHLDDYLKGL